MTIELGTTYLGLELAHPIVASASPLTGRIETLLQLQDAGAAAVVLPSLFEEDAEREVILSLSASGFSSLVHAESTDHAPSSVPQLDVAQRHIQLVVDAKNHLHIPVIASLNGTTASSWIRHAKHLIDAGADALELNVYRVIADPMSSARTVEETILSLVSAVRSEVSKPLSVKIGPFFTALPSFVHRLVSSGADGIVLFNRFYQPDIDLDAMVVKPSLDLSTSHDLRLPLRWTALLSANTNANIALSSGVHDAADVVKALLVGATAVMTTSSLLANGINHLRDLHDGLCDWMEARDYESVSQLRGAMSVGNVPDPDAYERANYLRVIHEANSGYGMTLDFSS
jgi:dihydroorotate dehydrogenase (fumarate)